MNRPLSLPLSFAVLLSGSIVWADSSKKAPSCGPADYKNDDGGFCTPLPNGVERTPRSPSAGFVVFFPSPADSGHVLRVRWTKTSDKQRADELRKLSGEERGGTLEVLQTTKVAGGAFSVTHDATQSPTLFIFKMPTVQGVLVLEAGDRVVRCEAVVPAGTDARQTARNEAAFLDACRSLRLVGKASP